MQAVDELLRRAAADPGRRRDQRAEAGDADRDARLAERVVDAGGEAALLLRRRAEGDGDDRRVEQADAEERDELAGQDDRPRRAGARQREQDHADGDEGEADRDHDPVRDLLADLAARAGDDEVQDRAGQVDEAGLDGRQPEHLLQVERRVEEDREERRRDPEGRDLRARERRVAEEPQREHRVRRARLDDEEGDERHGGAGELGDDLRAAPADLVAAQQREHEQEEAGGERDLAGHVDGRRGGIARLLDLGARDPQAEDADRDVDQEDPLPVQAAGQRAADERADGEGGADGGAVGGQRARRAPSCRGRRWPAGRARRRT